LNKQEPKTMHGFVASASNDISIEYRLMSVVDHFDIDSHGHHCSNKSGGCSDICAPTPDGVTCLCPLGKILGEDKRVCNQANCVGDQWFNCQTGCIPAKYRCDGVNDCALGEDELHCRNMTTEVGCTSSQFQCKNGGCISSHFYCDGNADCQDGSDEPDTCPPYVCLGDGEYSCPNQHHCIPSASVCDGQADCIDKSDEANCNSTRSMCSSEQFYCSNTRICIHFTWVCDGDSDCEYGEDEDSAICDSLTKFTSTLLSLNKSSSTSMDLVYNLCSANQFKCANGQCIDANLVCDGKGDCFDGTDEGVGCSKFRYLYYCFCFSFINFLFLFFLSKFLSKQRSMPTDVRSRTQGTNLFLLPWIWIAEQRQKLH
jgi:hypothetical protein